MAETIKTGFYMGYNEALQRYLREKIKEMLETPRFKGLSQKEVCKEIGIEPAWFRRAVTLKKNQVALSTIVWIACQLGVEFDLEIPHFEYVKSKPEWCLHKYDRQGYCVNCGREK